MTIEEQLKKRIKERYNSLNAFCVSIGIPYSTLDSALKRGVGGAGVATMITVFDALDLDIESIVEENLREKNAPVMNTEALVENSGGNNIDMEKFYNVFVDLGYVKEGEDLSSNDLKFLLSIVDLLDAWFAKR